MRYSVESFQEPREWAAMTTLYTDTGESGCPEFHDRDIKFRDPSRIFLLSKGGWPSVRGIHQSPTLIVKLALIVAWKDLHILQVFLRLTVRCLPKLLFKNPESVVSNAYSSQLRLVRTINPLPVLVKVPVRWYFDNRRSQTVPSEFSNLASFWTWRTRNLAAPVKNGDSPHFLFLFVGGHLSSPTRDWTYSLCS